MSKRWAAWFTSLSPRPLRLMTILVPSGTVGQSLSRCAKAWEVSRAGMIPFQPADAHKGLQRLLIRHCKVLCAPQLLQVAVLGPNAWVVQPAAQTQHMNNMTSHILVNMTCIGSVNAI